MEPAPTTAAGFGGGPPRELTVVYDDGCPLCQRCRRWVMGQAHLVRFRFVAASEPWVVDWLGALVPVGDELVVVDDRGSVWVGPDAFIVCLWGLARHRSLAEKLQRPGARGMAKHIFHSVSAGRGVASLFLGDLPSEFPGPGEELGGGQCGQRSCTA